MVAMRKLLAVFKAIAIGGNVLDLALGFIIGTAFATLILYRMLNTYGSSRTSLVTYLLPPMALFYGVTILDEQIHLNAALGLVLILAGVAIGSGILKVVRGRRDDPAPATPRA